jgi:simple sugar transport system permease protein
LRKKTNLNQQTLQLLAIIAFLLIVMISLKPDRFLRPVNIDSMLLQIAEPGLFALCIAVVYLSKGIDLSIVAIANLVGITNGIILKTMLPAGSGDEKTLFMLIVCMGVALLIGLLCGFMNGLFIAEFKIFPILVTLGTQNLFMGIGLALTKGRAEGNFPPMLLRLGTMNILPAGKFMGIPLVTLFFLLVFVTLCVIVHKTAYGLKLQLFGANERASYFSGINNKKVIYITYMISGIVASLAGLMIMVRTNSAKAEYGGAYVFQVLLICELARITPFGGKGKIYNVLLSLVALQILSTGFNMMRVSPLIRDSLFGFLLVASIALDYLLSRRRTELINKRAVMGSGQAGQQQPERAKESAK